MAEIQGAGEDEMQISSLFGFLWVCCRFCSTNLRRCGDTIYPIHGASITMTLQLSPKSEPCRSDANKETNHLTVNLITILASAVLKPERSTKASKYLHLRN
jgi:hypothetical protein